jgi:hypothetical protein
MLVSLELLNPTGPVRVNYLNPLPVIFGGVAQGSIFSQNGNIANSPLTINFGTPCSTFTLATAQGSANLYVNFSNVATGGTADLIVFGGSSYTYQGQPIQNISILGASASGVYTIVAH